MSASDHTILVTDAGGSSTQWLLSQAGKAPLHAKSAVFHPTHLSIAEIEQQLHHWLTQQHWPPIDALYYYSAGLLDERLALQMREVLSHLFPHAKVEVATDMLAAARASCGHKSGLVAILGTGANSCWYDGTNCEIRRRGYGFILGDEGSGAVLGLSLLRALLYDLLPNDLDSAWRGSFTLSADDIIEKVYRQALPNKFLASFVPFIHAHKQHAFIQKMLTAHFDAFFIRMMAPYTDKRNYPLHVVGSIGFYFEKELRAQANARGFEIGRIIQSPLTASADFHINAY